LYKQANFKYQRSEVMDMKTSLETNTMFYESKCCHMCRMMCDVRM